MGDGRLQPVDVCPYQSVGNALGIFDQALDVLLLPGFELGLLLSLGCKKFLH